MTDEDYVERINEQRAEKETYFAEHPRSPFPGHADFEGLDHYEVDPEYRYELP